MEVSERSNCNPERSRELEEPPPCAKPEQSGVPAPSDEASSGSVPQCKEQLDQLAHDGDGREVIHVESQRQGANHRTSSVEAGAGNKQELYAGRDVNTVTKANSTDPSREEDAKHVPERSETSVNVCDFKQNHGVRREEASANNSSPGKMTSILNHVETGKVYQGQNSY